MARWYPFNPERVSFEFNEEKLAAHGITVKQDGHYNNFKIPRTRDQVPPAFEA